RPCRCPRRTASSRRSRTTRHRWRPATRGPCACPARSRSGWRPASASAPAPGRPARPPLPSRPLPILSSSLAPFGIHAVDDVLVLAVHERPLQLHGRSQLLVLRREDLLDQAERLDRLHPGQLLVDPLDLVADELLHFPGAAQRGEVGEWH